MNHWEEKIRHGFTLLENRLELARCDLIDKTGFPVYRADIKSRHEGSKVHMQGCFWGKGFTADVARSAALAEATERLIASVFPDTPLIRASYDDLKECALDPASTFPSHRELLPANRTLVYSPDRMIQWIKGYSYTTGKEIYLPAAYVFLCPPSTDGLISATSNGLACGQDYPATILHAMCELVERDAMMVVMRNRLVMSDIDPVSFNPAIIKGMLKKGLHVSFKDITTDIGIPTVVAIIRDIRGEFPEYTYGFAACPAAKTACEHALMEAAQSRVVELFYASKYGIYQFTDPGKREDIFSHLVADSGTMKTVADMQQVQGENTAELIENCFSLVKKALPKTDLFIVRLTRKEMDIPVVRAIIPGLVPPQANYVYVLPRLLEVPHKMGLRNRKVRVDELWTGTWPH